MKYYLTGPSDHPVNAPDGTSESMLSSGISRNIFVWVLVCQWVASLSDAAPARGLSYYGLDFVSHAARMMRRMRDEEEERIVIMASGDFSSRDFSWTDVSIPRGCFWLYYTPGVRGGGKKNKRIH